MRIYDSWVEKTRRGFNTVIEGPPQRYVSLEEYSLLERKLERKIEMVQEIAERIRYLSECDAPNSDLQTLANELDHLMKKNFRYMIHG